MGTESGGADRQAIVFRLETHKLAMVIHDGQKEVAMKHKAVPAGEFKSGCLRIMDAVHKTGIPVLVTRRGKPLVRVVPAREGGTPVSLEGTITYEADDIFSTGERFEAES
jgi:prevent-host-death family protein